VGDLRAPMEAMDVPTIPCLRDQAIRDRDGVSMNLHPGPPGSFALSNNRVYCSRLCERLHLPCGCFCGCCKHSTMNILKIMNVMNKTKDSGIKEERGKSQEF